MKALTIWQPWASLIMAGAKPYEFRGWRAPRSIIGQRIVIHAAAKAMDFEEVEALYQIHAYRGKSVEIDQSARETCLITAPTRKVLAQALVWPDQYTPYACGLGTAIVGEPRLGTDIAEEFGVPRANDSTRDEHANWGWPMLDIEVWPEPIPMRGKQGLWNWPEPGDVL